MAKPAYRHEIKYYITSASANLLKRRLALCLKTDENSTEAGNYYIRSLYFDDIYSSAYFDKIDGIQEREKYRIRFYNLSKDFIALEKKTKHDNFIYKKSTVIDEQICNDILNRDIWDLWTKKSRLLQEFYLEMRLKNLKPQIIIDYYRTAFEFPHGKVRITVDENLKTALWRTSLFDDNLPLTPVLKDSEAILEIKYDKVIPAHILKILDCAAKDRCAISKYVLCNQYLH